MTNEQGQDQAQMAGLAKSRAAGPILLMVGITALAGAIIALSWIGYRAYADDVFAIRGALLWLQDFPYLGTTHWELRHPLVLSVAASVGLLGLNEFSIMLPNILAFILLLFLVWAMISRWQGKRAAVIAVLLIATTPIFPFGASTLFPGLIELLFVVLSVALFMYALEQPQERRNGILFIAGLAGGLAFVTRETAAALALFYAILFVAGFGMKRLRYFVIGVGFLVPVLADVAYVSFATGDPLYRYRIDLEQHHPWKEMTAFDFLAPQPSAEVPSASGLPESSQLLEIGRVTKAVGPVDINPYLNPYVALWTNHEYAALFFVALLAVAFLIGSRNFRSGLALPIKLFGLLGATWFVMAVYVFAVRPHPRYFLPFVLAAALLNAAWIANLFSRSRFVIAGSVLVASLAAGLLAFDLHSERLHEEPILVEVAGRYQETVHAPRQVTSAARFLTQTNGVEGYVSDAPPPPGALYLFSEESLAELPPAQRRFYFHNDWQELERWEPRQRLLGRLLDTFGLLEHLPPTIAAKVNRPTPTILLYRVSPAPKTG